MTFQTSQILRLTGLLLCAQVFVSGCASFNQPVIEDLESSEPSARAERVLLITLPDGARFPVRYLRQETCIYLGAGGGWWRQLEQPAAVTLLLQGRSLDATAQAFPQADPELRRGVMRALRDHWTRAWLRFVRPGTLVVANVGENPSPQRCLNVWPQQLAGDQGKIPIS